MWWIDSRRWSSRSACNLYVRVAAIDGPDGVAAQSTICARRAAADGGLPFIGSVTFDADDLATLETRIRSLSLIHDTVPVVRRTGGTAT